MKMRIIIKFVLRLGFSISMVVIGLFTNPAFSQSLVLEEIPGFTNSEEYQDYNISVSPKGDRIIFLRVMEDDEKVFMETVKEGEKWSDPKPLELIRLTLGELDIMSTASFSADGNTIYFHAMFQGTKGHPDLYSSQRINGQWHAPVNLGSPFNTEYFEISPWISPDGSRLYFTKELPEEKKADIQIYFSERKGDGSWGSLQQWSPDLQFIHTEHPVVFRDNAMLLYAKIRKDNDHQTYLSVKINETKWSSPVLISIDEDRLMALDETFKTYVPRNLTTTLDFNYIYLFLKGNLYRAPVPESLQGMVNSSPTPTAEQPEIQTRISQENAEPEKDKYVKPDGKYYALLIGNSDYELNELNLDRPVEDVKVLSKTLTDYYQFDEKNIVTLLNSDRENIMQELYRLRQTINRDDNLLIFYAGHGKWDDKVKQGYWWPVDANPNNPSNWLSNSDIREQIRGINSAHTLLISDACFSGGIFKTRSGAEIKKAGRDIQLLYRMPSRRAITSGTLSTVPDNSVFFKYLIKYLKENEKKFISSSELFTTIRASVLNNSLTVPQDGVILNTGDEGGDFIFIKR